jgi:hypothetical protein
MTICQPVREKSKIGEVFLMEVSKMMVKDCSLTLWRLYGKGNYWCDPIPGWVYE